MYIQNVHKQECNMYVHMFSHVHDQHVHVEQMKMYINHTYTCTDFIHVHVHKVLLILFWNARKHIQYVHVFPYEYNTFHYDENIYICTYITVLTFSH